jgi:transcriptional regulator with XRE-family HTH domain
MFGEFIKQIRERQRLDLREFCLENGYDPSKWRKTERGVLPPSHEDLEKLVIFRFGHNSE